MTLAELYSSLDTDTAIQFVSYLNKIDNWRICSFPRDEPETDVSFWELMRELYDASMQYIIEFDAVNTPPYDFNADYIEFNRNNRQYNVAYRWKMNRLVQVPEWFSLVNFLNIVSLSITNDCTDNVALLFEDIMKTGLLNNQPAVHFEAYGSGEITLAHNNGYGRGRCGRSPIRYTQLSFCDAKEVDQLSQMVSAKYPLIEEILIDNSIFPIKVHAVNHYNVNLCPYKNLRCLSLGFTSRFSVCYNHLSGVIVVLIREDDVDYYWYKGTHVIHISSMVDTIIEKPKVLRVFCAQKLTTLMFKRGYDKEVLPIVEG